MCVVKYSDVMYCESCSDVYSGWKNIFMVICINRFLVLVFGGNWY